MTEKAYITKVGYRTDGSLIIDYFDGKSYRWKIFYYYSKKEALRKLRQELGIKRDVYPIEDTTVDDATIKAAIHNTLRTS